MFSNFFAIWSNCKANKQNWQIQFFCGAGTCFQPEGNLNYCKSVTSPTTHTGWTTQELILTSRKWLTDLSILIVYWALLLEIAYQRTLCTKWYKMVEHTQTIRRLLPTNYLSVFDLFVGLALKGLREIRLSMSLCFCNNEK